MVNQLIEDKINTWIKDVSPYIAAHIEAGLSEEVAIINGLNDYRKISEEMAVHQSKRSRIAYRAITERAYHVLHANLLPNVNSNQF
jgi:hypothetical protein